MNIAKKIAVSAVALSITCVECMAAVSVTASRDYVDRKTSVSVVTNDNFEGYWIGFNTNFTFATHSALIGLSNSIPGMIQEMAPELGNYQAVSNAAMNARSMTDFSVETNGWVMVWPEGTNSWMRPYQSGMWISGEAILGFSNEWYLLVPGLRFPIMSDGPSDAKELTFTTTGASPKTYRLYRGDRLAFSSEIVKPDYSMSNQTLVDTIMQTAPAPGNYSAVSNAAMSALSRTEAEALASTNYVNEVAQEKLSDAQISAIDSVVDERKTVVTYNDGTVAQYDIIGKLEGDVNPSTGTPIPTRQIPNVTNVRHIVIGSGVTEIVDKPFIGCHLESIKLPDNGLVLGQFALANCDLHTVEIPESVGAIGYEAFAVNPLAQVLFIGKPIPDIQAMENYPWGITDTSIINTWNAAPEEWVEERVEAVAADLRYRIAEAGYDSHGVRLPDGVTVTNGEVQITGYVVWEDDYQCWSLPETYTTWYEDGALKEYYGAQLGVQYYLNGEPIDTPPNLVGVKRVLADRTVNRITADDGTTSIDIELPDPQEGYSRDFYLSVTCGSTAPTLNMPSGVTLLNAKGEPANLALTPSATTVLRFTEVKEAGQSTSAVFCVTGGANSGGGSIDIAVLGNLRSKGDATVYTYNSWHDDPEEYNYTLNWVESAGRWEGGGWTLSYEEDTGEMWWVLRDPSVTPERVARLEFVAEDALELVFDGWVRLVRSSVYEPAVPADKFAKKSETATVAPSTDAYAQGKPADAKATGEKLAGKLSTGGGTMTGDFAISHVPTDTKNVFRAGSGGDLFLDTYYGPGVARTVQFPVYGNGIIALVSQIPDISGKADAADLSYRIAEAGYATTGAKLPDDVTVMYDGAELSDSDYTIVQEPGESVIWALLIIGMETGIATWNEDGSFDNSGGSIISFLRNGASVEPRLIVPRALTDRTVNLITAMNESAAIDVEFPSPVINRSRDFYLSVLTSSNAPTLNVTSAVSLINSMGGDPVLTLTPNATNVLRFTEVEEDVFYVTGGANGGGGGGGGVTDYRNLTNLPKINGVTLGGTNNTAVGLGLIGTSALAGQTFDFTTNAGLYLAVSNLITALGGSVTNFPAIPQGGN